MGIRINRKGFCVFGICCLVLSCNQSNPVNVDDGIPIIMSSHNFITPNKVVTSVNDYVWTTGDKIAVVWGNGVHSYLYDGPYGPDKASFSSISDKISSENPKDSCLSLVFPYEAVEAITKDGPVVSITSTQALIGGCIDTDKLIYVSNNTSINQKEIYFKLLQGILTIDVDIPNESIDSVIFSGNNSEILSGEATIYTKNGKLDFSDVGGAKNIHLECNGFESDKLDILIPPIEFKKGFTITIYTKSGKSFTKTYSQPYVFDSDFSIEVSFKTNSTDITSFSLTDGEKLFSAFLIKDYDIHVVVPNACELSSLREICEHNGSDYYVDPDCEGSFRNFNSPIRYIVKSINGGEKKWNIHVYNLPVIAIDTPNKVPINSREQRIEGGIMVQVNEDGSIDSLGTAGIKGRGNATWTQSNKKPYNVKLDKKASILGMKKSKHWTMLANALYDRSQLHNAVALYFASLTDYSWIPEGQFCEVLLNGKHLGLYFICEKIRVEKGKIDITEIGPNDLSGNELTGGYMIESTIYTEQAEGIYFSLNHFNMSGGYPLYWFYDLPDGEESDIPQEQQDYIRERLNHLESLIYNSDSLRLHKYVDYLDIGSLINWFLVEEVCQNEEASRTKNVRLYKDRGDEHFVMGPPWDFDAWTFGYTDYNRWLTKDDALWLKQLFKDPLFVEKVKEKWNQYKPLWETKGLRYMDEQYNRIYKAAKRNEKMWPEWVGNYRSMTFEETVTQMRDAIIHRIQWMDERIQSW